MAEVEEARYTVQLVPDIIRYYLIEEYGFLDDIKSVLSFRLISKVWNESLRDLVGTKTVTILSDENLSDFEQFLSSDASAKLQSSNIRSVVLNIRCDFEKSLALQRSGSSEGVYLKKALDDFVRLPSFFRSQLMSFKLNFEVDKPPDFADICKFFVESQLDLLEELEILVCRHGYSVPLFPLDVLDSFESIRFQFLRKLTVPIHVSLTFLRHCSVLNHVSLQIFDEIELPSDFWESFKNAVVSNDLNESIDELFFVDKRRFDTNLRIKISFSHLCECKFQLKKLGLGLPYSHYLPHEKLEITKFFIQQSASLEYLQLAKKAGQLYMNGTNDNTFIFNEVRFQKLTEIRCEELYAENRKLLPHCPNLEKLHVDLMPRYSSAPSFFNNWKSLPITSLVVKDLNHTAFKMFPSLNSLEIEDQVSLPRTLTQLFKKTRALKKLSIKVQFNIVDQRRLKRHRKGWYQPLMYYNSNENFRRGRSRPIKADCFILGQKPRHCKLFHSGQLVCDDTTEFRIPSQPSIVNFQNLEHLSLGGYFTEMTLWAGIQQLTQLKELHLTTQYLLHPRTLLKLESNLVQIQTWSYTKLAEIKYGYREMYKCFRILPEILKLEKIHVWKFNDDGVEKKVVTLAEFDNLDLTYTGTRDEMVPAGFWPEPESESDFDGCPSPETSTSESQHESEEESDESDQDSEFDVDASDNGDVDSGSGEEEGGEWN